MKTKTRQVRVGLAHEGFRTIIAAKNQRLLYGSPLNIYFILFLVFVVIAATQNTSSVKISTA